MPVYWEGHKGLCAALIGETGSADHLKTFSPATWYVSFHILESPPVQVCLKIATLPQFHTVQSFPKSKSDLTDSTTLPPLADLLLSGILVVSSEVVEVNLVVVLNLQAYLATKTPEGNTNLDSVETCH